MSSVMVCSQRQALAVDPSPQALAPLNAALAVLGITYVFATRVGLEPLTCVELNGQLVVASDTSLPCSLEWNGT